MAGTQSHVRRGLPRRPHGGSRGGSGQFRKLAAELAQIGGKFYTRGWVLATSGNFSTVISRQPFRLAITPTGADKGALLPGHFLEINEAGQVIRGDGQPSAECKIHLALAKGRGAEAVFHTHSVWSTIVSDAFASDGGVSLEGFEMLKGLDGVRTHEHREWLPILENRQEIGPLARSIEEILRKHPASHGFLLRRHGLYTWGRSLAEAERHVEILEFLLEVLGRSRNARC